MSNSSLVCYTALSPNNSGRRTSEITKITPHHMSGNLSIETCGNVFAPSSRQASSNYGIGSDGRVGMYVEECNRAWTSSSGWNDQQAVTIEVANSYCGGDWPISDEAWNTLVNLCVDICRRNPGIKRADGRSGLHYTGDKCGSLTKHKMFAATDCPGTWLDNHMIALQDAVNAILDGGKAPEMPATATTPVANGTIDQIARDVIAGKYGNGAQRKAALGAKYDQVQARVNEILNGGGSTSAPAPAPSTNEGKGFGGTYRCTVDGLRVRTAPSTSSEVVAHYNTGDTVILDDWYQISGGWVWGRYTGASSGQKRYVAVGKPTGGYDPSDYLVKI